MFNKFFTLLVSTFCVLIVSTLSFGQAIVFQDNFDSYTAGVQVVVQNPTDWTTWSNLPGSGEDPFVSDAYSSSPSNSVNIIANNDFVHVFPNYTTGKWSMSFKLYIETGFTGYFNTLSDFAGGSSQWAMQVYFNTGGLGDMDAGGASAHQFTYPYDTWMDVEVIADLDSDVGEFWLNGTMEYSWVWSTGTFGTGILQLGGNNFYGGGTDGVPDYYMDDYTFTDLLAPPPSFFDDFDSYTAGVQLCTQTTEWQTWSNLPGSAEDPFVSDAYSYSGSNSTVIVQDNDLVRLHGQKTSGKWYISFLVYIPTGASGYFNTMSGFDPNPYEWAMECYFNAGGAGSLENVPVPTAFTWVEDMWQQVVVVVDLDLDNAEFWFGSGNPLSLIATWQWTQGATVNLQLDANDLFGAAATDEMYVDDFYFGDTPPVILPVELTSFSADVNNSGNVILNWSTATELNNQMFEIERRSNEGQYATIGYVNGHGTTTEAQEYSYLDNTVRTGTYYYRLKQIDFGGRYEYSYEIEVEVNGPLTFALKQNYPNPFNPSTTIEYNVPETGNVRLAIYNALGEEVAVLIDGFVEAGFHSAVFDASSLSSGAYFYKLQAGNSTEVKKMLLMK